MQLRHVPLTDPLVVPLLAGLGDEYRERYGLDDLLADTDPAEFEPPDGTFVVLVDDAGRTAAGGGLRRRDDDACEIKRMWTSPQHRREGLASAVLTALETTAAERGYARLVLETGPEQPEALAMYRRRGYRPIPNYGAHEVALAFEWTVPASH